MRIAGGFLIINSETRFLRFLIINSESGFLIINSETRFLRFLIINSESGFLRFLLA
jgi:hypothetical protein